MKVHELIKNSPVRVFEESINGGLGNGNIGILASKHGVGKTACLVHLATDRMLRGENVIQVSFGTNVEHTLGWYKEVFKEITDFKSTGDAFEAYEAIRNRRVMMNFSQENLTMDKVTDSLKTLINDGSFRPASVYFDGYRLAESTASDIEKLKLFAKSMNVELWLSVSSDKNDSAYDEYGIPDKMKDCLNLIDVVVGLHYDEVRNRVVITVVKDHKKSIPHPTGVFLDPKTMLITP